MVLGGRARSRANAGDGSVQCARLSKLAKGSAAKAGTQAINQLKAVLITADLLLCIDELGYLDLGRHGAELLFQVLDEREEKNSVALASNESFGGCTRTFTDPRLCVAIVDRLTGSRSGSPSTGRRSRESWGFRCRRTTRSSRRRSTASSVIPSTLVPGGKGLVEWGSTEWADEYFWLIEPERPGEYPVLVRSNDVDAWHRYDRSTSEFLYRILADADFPPFGIAQYDLGTMFKPGSGGLIDGQPL